MNQRHLEKRLNAWRYLLAMPRSIWYNFRLLPWRQACRLPLLVSHRTVVENLSGHLVLDAERLKVGLVKVGFNTCQCSDFHYDRTHLNLRGELHLYGKCAIGAGSHIEVAENAILSLGDDFNLGPKSLIVCHHSITFGRRVLTSWCCTFMDTDQHSLVDSDGNRTNPDRPVTVGDNVWFGCHVILTKGVQMASDITVGAGSRLVGKYLEPRTVLSGNPAQVVRRGVKRGRDE